MDNLNRHLFRKFSQNTLDAKDNTAKTLNGLFDLLAYY